MRGDDAGASRRAFLRRGLRQATGAVDELLSVTGAGGADGSSSPAEGPRAAPRIPPPARRLLREDELLRLADEEGLGGREADVRRLARTSLRVVPATGRRPPEGHRGSWLWGVPPEAGERTWPERDDTPLLGLCHLDLGELAGWVEGVPLPGAGSLTMCFSDATAAGAAPGPVDCGTAHVVVQRDGALGRAFAARPAARPALLVPELSLPRPWAAAVQELDLDGAALEAWARLRARVAARQHVTLFDEAPEELGLHRVLGHADERLGLAPGAGWELLLQVTVVGSAMAAGWLVERTRVYLWIRSSAWARADFGDVRVIAS